MAVLNRQCEGIIELIASIYFAESCPASPNASLITTARRRRRTLRDLDMRMARRTERQPRRAGQGPTTISTCEDCKTDYIHLHAQQPDMDMRLVLLEDSRADAGCGRRNWPPADGLQGGASTSCVDMHRFLCEEKP